MASESLTPRGGVCIELDGARVIHFDDDKLWPALLRQVPTTPNDVESVQLQWLTVQHLFQTTAVKDQRILVMSGHDGELITFGRNLGEALPS
jgi:hypothetical protein